MKWVFFFFFSGIIFFTGSLLVKIGAFKSVNIQGIVEKEFYFIGQEHRGSYHLINEKIKQVENWAIENNIICSKTYGEYLDVPGSMEEARLTSFGGCVFEKALQMDLPKDFKFEHREVKKYISAKFLGSPAISPYKVYPKVESWLQQNRMVADGPVIEIYRLIGKDGMETEYFFPIKTRR